MFVSELLRNEIENSLVLRPDQNPKNDEHASGAAADCDSDKGSLRQQ